jgi:hypothetical protein
VDQDQSGTDGLGPVVDKDDPSVLAEVVQDRGEEAAPVDRRARPIAACTSVMFALSPGSSTLYRQPEPGRYRFQASRLIPWSRLRRTKSAMAASPVVTIPPSPMGRFLVA